MTPAASLPLHKSGKLVQKKRCLCGAEIIQKCKCKILAKAGEMDEHSLELLAASCQVITTIKDIKSYFVYIVQDTDFFSIFILLLALFVDSEMSSPSKSNKDRLQYAFDIAEKELGIAKLLDPEDVDVENPDEKSVMTYVAQFLHKYADNMSQAVIFIRLKTLSWS